MPVEPREDSNEAAVEAVGALIHEIDPGAFAQGFLLIVEVLGEDGQTGLWCLAPPGQKMWHSLGFVETVKAMEYAREAGSSDG